MEKKKFKLPPTAYLSYFLLALFLLSFVTFSRYVTSTDNSETGRSAIFQVDVDSQADTLVLDVNEGILSDSFIFSVTSNSEIGVYYDVSIDFQKDLPENLTIQLDGKDVGKVENNVYTFLKVGEFEPLDEDTHEHTLTFIITEDLEENIELSDLQIKVLISQED